MGRNGRKGRDKERSRNAVGGGEQEPDYGVNGIGLLITSGGLAPRAQFADRSGARLLYTTCVCGLLTSRKLCPFPAVQVLSP